MASRAYVPDGRTGQTRPHHLFHRRLPQRLRETSTAMLPGQSIVGDDIAYLRKIDGQIRAVNVEKGIFGIIQDVNPEDDPLIYEALTTPREVIFSMFWSTMVPLLARMGQDPPAEGFNYSGEWHQGKDENGKEIPFASKNARYTIAINELDNADPNLNEPLGVPVKAIVYGGRDSYTTVPIAESLTWEHGVFLGATVESETTAATIGKEGVRTHDPMANKDFISVPLATYLRTILNSPKDWMRRRPFRH